MTPWLLLDYGDVISRPYDETVGEEVAALIGIPRAEMMTRYWDTRLDLDRGEPTPAYWTHVAGRPVDAEEALRLDVVDQRGWARTDPEMLALIAEQAAAGTRLALFSNAPHVQADVFDREPWLASFEHVFASARLGLVKPTLEAFRHVLSEMGATPSDVTFVDDRQVNVDGARAVGMEAVLFEGVPQLRAALGR